LEISIFYDRLRWEEKALADEARAVGLTANLVDARALAFDISKKSTSKKFGAGVLQRCISHYRALFSTRILESVGVPVVNSYAVAETCGNKLATTMALARARVPTPRTVVSLSSDSVDRAAKTVRFPLVMKPFTGSWGRMVSVAKDEDTLDSLVEMREEMHNPLEHMYYIQEYVKRPPRDIRAVVVGDQIAACVYRYSAKGDWRTNVARGGKSKEFKPAGHLAEMIIRAAEAVGGGVLGVDAMESPDGYLIHEVNNTVEFRGAQSAVDSNIAKQIVRYVSSVVKK
jgi:[lysine-biosynthesis-protein LysW]---L-2-aminoadipate ligase